MEKSWKSQVWFSNRRAKWRREEKVRGQRRPDVALGGGGGASTPTATTPNGGGAAPGGGGGGGLGGVSPGPPSSSSAVGSATAAGAGSASVSRLNINSSFNSMYSGISQPIATMADSYSGMSSMNGSCLQQREAHAAHAHASQPLSHGYPYMFHHDPLHPLGSAYNARAPSMAHQGHQAHHATVGYGPAHSSVPTSTGVISAGLFSGVPGLSGLSNLSGLSAATAAAVATAARLGAYQEYGRREGQGLDGLGHDGSPAAQLQ
ncbi:Paired box protein Pax-6 [Frankliniella fusca]|uniref:Paired box protein Pax-6 n=1 Tax=Frankliniella fusca TaxID=407009 RepID=A0AAE1HJI7_9NEOP|nr:Paired box protein Pax-6 [Frankliniella fusca]